MTSERLRHINRIEDDLDSAGKYLELAEQEENCRSKIRCLTGNAPHLVKPETYEAIWDLMKVDAMQQIAAWQEEFEKA